MQKMKKKSRKNERSGEIPICFPSPHTHKKAVKIKIKIKIKSI